ncbi:MAG: LCP family protein [Syntrophomonadaceae bacterium]|nr:LCP family protein [Syntrophomonadaceae bacterium]
MGRVKANYRLIITCISIFLITFAAGAFIGNHLQVGPFDRSITAKAERGKQINILFMGIDARKMETNSRSDTMILASIDSKAKKIAMVWIPRDTRVEVKRNHYDKINSVNYLQGPEAACKVVGDLLDIRVDHYVVTNFAGFAKIIDILDGVTLDVETDMFHKDPDPQLRINLSRGVQKLNGQDALGYVRYRGTPTADIGRTGRQQKFIKALAQEMLQGKTILKLPELLPELVKNVHTNIPVTDMMTMAKLAKDFDSLEIYTQTLPGYSYTDRQTGASYWEADPKIAAGIIDDLFAGKKYDVAQDPPNWVKKKPEIKLDPVVEEEPEITENGEEGTGELSGEQPGDPSNPEPTEGQPLPGDKLPGETGTEPVVEPGEKPETGTDNIHTPPGDSGEIPSPQQSEQPAPLPQPASIDNTSIHGY